MCVCVLSGPARLSLRGEFLTDVTADAPPVPPKWRRILGRGAALGAGRGLAGPGPAGIRSLYESTG